MPPMQAGAPAAPAKTMFGHAAPVIPRAPGQPAAPNPPAQGGFAPPQQQGFAAPQAGQPARPQAGPQPGQPARTMMAAGGPGPQQPAQAQSPGGFGQPPQFGGPPSPQSPQQFGGPPQQQFGGPPPQQPGFGQPPPQFGGPPQQPGFPPPQQNYGQPPQFGGPPQQPGFPPPQQNYGQPPQFGGPPQQPGFPPPQQPGFGQPPQQFGQPQGFPPPQPGYPPPGGGFGGQPQGGFPPAQPQYPAAGGFGMAPQQDLPGPLDNMARGLPQSAPGTIFGIPVARLRDVGLQRTVLFMAGVALIASIVVPTSISKLTFPFSDDSPIRGLGIGMFGGVIFPIIAGGAYLLVAAAPAELRQKVPPIVIQWLPFGVSILGVLMLAPMIFPATALTGGGGLYAFAYALLLFGLLARIAKPTDQTARVVIAIGAGLLLIPFLSMIGPTFKFGGGIVDIIYGLLNFIVTLLGILCVLFVVPPQKLPPALQAVDAFGPLICATLLGWLVVGPVLLLVDGIISGQIVIALLLFVRILLYVIAFIGVLLMSSPSAYESLFEVPMMRRSPLNVLLHCLIPLFGVLWLVETKEALKKRTGLPLLSGWWIAVPFGSIYFLWKWAEGVEKATGYSKMNAFLLTAFLAPVGIWIVQGKFNALEGGAMQAPPPQQAMGGGGYPPPGGGYPPPGGGYPPPGGGGYPPPGGGYPPPGGGYPA